MVLTIDESSAQDLEAIISGDANVELTQEVDDALFPIANTTSSSMNEVPLLGHSTEFIEYFAAINVVRNAHLGIISPAKLLIEAHKHVAIGNSRNFPTIHMIRCPNHVFGCHYEGKHTAAVTVHLARCKILSTDIGIKKNTPKMYICEHGECTASYDTQKPLTRHIKEMHEWQPQRCPRPNCHDETVWPSLGKMTLHLTNGHSLYPGTRCRFSGCTTDRVFTNAPSYSAHLQGVHKLRTAKDRAPFLPTWKPRPCHVKGCSTTKSYQNLGSLVTHLEAKHDLHPNLHPDPYLAYDP